MSKKTVGILGGMGPLSTIELMKKVVEQTPVEMEQDHIRMLVDNRPEIPDRTEFILGKGPSPIPMLQESALKLEKWGADFLAVPCNSAHAFIRQIGEAINIPVLDMIDLVRIELERNLSSGASVGILATAGTIHSNLYHNYLRQFLLITPDPETQKKLVMGAIYGENGFKKTGTAEGSRQKLLEAIETMMSKKPQAIIAGCTEVELTLKNTPVVLPVFYPLDILAVEIVKVATAISHPKVHGTPDQE
jgi:aspartate racemase